MSKLEQRQFGRISTQGPSLHSECRKSSSYGQGGNLEPKWLRIVCLFISLLVFCIFSYLFPFICLFVFCVCVVVVVVVVDLISLSGSLL